MLRRGFTLSIIKNCEYIYHESTNTYQILYESLSHMRHSKYLYILILGSGAPDLAAYRCRNKLHAHMHKLWVRISLVLNYSSVQHSRSCFYHEDFACTGPSPSSVFNSDQGLIFQQKTALRTLILVFYQSAQARA